MKNYFSLLFDLIFYSLTFNKFINSEVSVSSHGFTNILHDKKNSRLFTTNEVGVISVYSVATVS
jgi:hypothetical protein